MQACTDPLWPFTLYEMLNNTHKNKKMSNANSKKLENEYFYKFADLMEVERKKYINSKEFQEMVSTNPNLHHAMNNLNFASRVKDFSKG